jgi:hypothetical protein
VPKRIYQFNPEYGGMVRLRVNFFGAGLDGTIAMAAVAYHQPPSFPSITVNRTEITQTVVNDCSGGFLNACTVLHWAVGTSSMLVTLGIAVVFAKSRYGVALLD